MGKFSKLWTIIGSVLILSMFGIVSVSAAGSDCPAFSGTTTGTAGLNEGVFVFDGDLSVNPGGGMDSDNAACVKTQTDYSSDRVMLEGWVWNDNLGLISLKGGLNTETDTPGTYYSVGGTVNYESYLYVDGAAADLDLTTDFHAGSETTVPVGALQLGGYWWGENLGWLRLNCQEFSSTEDGDAGDADDDYCASSGHRVYVQSIVGGIAQLSGHAWSDSQGWVDFDGVEMDVTDLYQQIFAKVEISPVRNTGSRWTPSGVDVVRANGHIYRSENSTEFRNASGETGYGVQVSFYDNDAFTGARLNISDVDFCFVWNDDRYLDYTNAEATNPIEIDGCYTADDENKNPFGLLEKELNQDDFGYRTSGRYYLSDNFDVIRSQVPATADELYLDAIVVNGQRQDLGPDYALPFAAPYDYKLFQGQLEGECADYELTQEDRFLDLFLGFNEQITLCGDFYQEGLGDAADLIVNTDYILDDGPDWDLTDLYFEPQESEEYLICVGEDEEADYVELDDAINPNDVVPTGYVDEAIIWLGIFNEESCEEGANASLDSVNIDSVLLQSEFITTVRYNTATGMNVFREAARLEKGEFSVSQANIEGNVQSSAIQLFDDDVNYSSSGGSVRAETRESVLKDFSELLKGARINCTVNDGEFDESIENCQVGNEELYVIDFRGASREVARKSVLMSDLLADWDEDDEDVAGFAGRTLVVIGSSIIVDDNLFFRNSDGDYDADKAYGLVALTDAKGRKGGNIYIESGVTDIRGYIYTDGSVFSVENAELVGDTGGSSNGVVSRLGENRENLFNQLTIVGLVVSQNTVGGGTSSTPIGPDGALLNEFDRQRAKAADLNFWRYSPMGLSLSDGPSGELIITMCGQEDADTELRETMEAAVLFGGLESSIDLDAGTLTMGALNTLINEYDLEVSKFFCWNNERGLTSQYFDTERGAADSQPPYKRFVLNILFDVVPKGLPLF